MDLLPLDLIGNIYKYKHEMQYASVMDQLKLYRLNTVFVVSLDFLKRGYYSFGGVRSSCIDINNIDALSGDIISLINYDYCNRRFELIN